QGGRGSQQGHRRHPQEARHQVAGHHERRVGRAAVRIALAEPPPIDLPDPNKAATPAPGPQSNWIYVDGKWVKVRPGIEGTPQASRAAIEQSLVTQRVIKIPTGPLLAGAA